MYAQTLYDVGGKRELELAVAERQVFGAHADQHVLAHQARLAAAARPGDDWITHGGGWQEQRFSPLTQINDKNAGRLGLLWYDDLSTYRGVEATPLEVDGVLYNISAWDVTTAYNAITGKFNWEKMERFAVWGGTTATAGNIVLYGTLDGFIKARDSDNGDLLWKFKLPSGAIGYPITYTHKGTQYVAINYGVGGWPGVGLVFDLQVLSYGDEQTRVTVDVVPLGPMASEVVVTHEMGANNHARMMEEGSRKGWTNMLATLERELFPRRVGVHL